jgi:hypothetical protein
MNLIVTFYLAITVVAAFFTHWLKVGVISMTAQCPRITATFVIDSCVLNTAFPPFFLRLLLSLIVNSDDADG